MSMNEKMKSFQDAIEPAQRWLKENGCPHDLIVIDWQMGTIYENRMGVVSSGTETIMGENKK